MCDHCPDAAMDRILDFIVLGAGLEVAIALARDLVVQYSLADGGDLDDVRHISDLITEKGQELREMNAEDYESIVVGHYMSVAMS